MIEVQEFDMRSSKIFEQAFLDGFTFGGLFGPVRLPNEPDALFDADGSGAQLTVLLPEEVVRMAMTARDEEDARGVTEASTTYREAIANANRRRHTIRTQRTQSGT